MNNASHRPRKRFGQNFLQDQYIIDSILRAIHLQPKDRVIEIGPGLGALTKPLLQRLESLTAIEIDTDLQAKLLAMPESNKLTLIGGDALSIDYSQFGEQIRFIGNLPYNISTPILFHLLNFTPYILDMHFMLQKEVVERLAATPGNKSYGRLSVMVQYYCEVEYVLDVPAEAFFPKPKVLSAVVSLTPRQDSIYPHVALKDLESLVATAFSMRRKTLANNLKPLMTNKEIESLGIDPSLRPEQLSVMQYVNLTQFVCS